MPGDLRADEGPRRGGSLEKMAELKTLPGADRLTAGVASQISDASAALLIASEAAVKQHGLKPRARIHHISVRGADPIWMLTAPIPATQHALKKAGMSLNDWLDSALGDPTPTNVSGDYCQQPSLQNRETREVADIHQRLDTIARKIEQMSRPAPRSDAPRGQPAVAHQQLADRRHIPRFAADQRAQASGQHARQVARQAAAGDMRRRLQQAHRLHHHHRPRPVVGRPRSAVPRVQVRA